MKMEKTPRYTQRERNMVLGFAAQYKDVIENKRTDAESNRKKDEVWRQIAKEFNCRVYHQRSSKQLRQLYKNMKLLLKKDLCGDGKSNRSFMDILNALSQQDSVAQYIQEQMSPGGYSSSRHQKFDDDFDDSKLPSVVYDGLDNDVIVIKSEDISDNDHSSHNGVGGLDDMDDDDDDCLSTKDIPEVCLEEEDDEIFATDLRQTTTTAAQQQAQTLQQQLQAVQQQQHRQTPPQPEITIQNVGGIRVGSIGNIASLTNAAKALQNASNSNNNSSSNNNNNSGNSNGNSALNISLATTGGNNRNVALSAVEQQQREQQQQLLFSGLGLSAVHTAAVAAAATAAADQQLPTLQHATQRNTASNSNSHQNHSNNHSSNHHTLSSLALNSSFQLNKIPHTSTNSSHHHNNSSHHHNNSSSHNSNSRNNEYLLSLAIEERKRKIDLLNAQIEYWKTLTKKLDANNGHNPTPSCLCHFPAKVNGLQSQQSSS